ncbi:MAG: pyrroline-5-carboxylate reductase [Armatimonadota bacterium]
MAAQVGRLAIVGAGIMGSAFAAGAISAGVIKRDDITIADVDAGKLEKLARELKVTIASDNASAARNADIVLIAVKPGIVPEVLDEIAGELTDNKLVISIAAGVKLATIESRLPGATKAIRAMPNTPCRIRAGAVAFARGRAAGDAEVAIAKRIFDSVGISFEVPENLLDAVTGLSGSGPAYVFVMIEALSDAGVRVGIPRDLSSKLAAQTVLGAARMIVEEDEHPARLKDQVASPGGTTIAGIDALEKAGFRSAIIEAVKAATNRAKELG